MCAISNNALFQQDFGINSKQDLVNIYDTIIDKVVNPVKEAIKSFNDIINLFRSGSITEIFQNMIRTLQKFPSAIGSTTRWFKVLFKLILRADVSAVIDTVKNIIQQFRQLFNDIEQDVGNFYHVSTHIIIIIIIIIIIPIIIIMIIMIIPYST